MNEGADVEADVFISYTSRDVGWAEWIASELERAGISTFLQAWDIPAGANFVRAMHEGTRGTRLTIPVLSPRYVDHSKYGADEWQARFAQDEQLVPVLVEAVPRERLGLLAPLAWIELVDVDEETARASLVERITSRLDGTTVDRKARRPFPGSAKTQHQARFPATDPDVWTVPHRRNPRFVGRDALFDRIRGGFAGRDGKDDDAPDVVLNQAATLHGLGGVGKSETALEYCHRYAHEYDVVAWLRAEEETTLRADLVELGIEVGVLKRGDEQDEDTSVTRVLAWLGRVDQALVVYDNAENYASIKRSLPTRGRAHVLVTSRDPNWNAAGTAIPVELFTRDEAVRFLLDRTGHDDEESAAALAAQVGILPLALEQAASYVEQTGMAFAAYGEALAERGLPLLERGQVQTDYEHTVATTWTLSLDRVAADHPAASTLLELCAYLAPDDIPVAMFRDHAGELPEDLAGAVDDAVEWADTIAAIRRYSLASVADDSLGMHRLVQDVVRARCTSTGRRDARLVTCVRTTAASLPEVSFETWDTCRRVLPHAETVLAHEPDAGERVRVLHFGVARYLQDHANYASALAHCRSSLTIAEAEYGPDHPEVATTLGNLGLIHQDRGDLDAAEDAQRRALAIEEAAYGPDHPEVAITLTNLGNIHQLRGALDAAGDAQRRALAIKEAAYGPDHPQVAITLTNLGNIHRDRGDLDAAEDAQRRALSIKEAAYGPDHPEVAITLTNLGNIHQHRGDLDAAEDAQRRALAIMEAAYGPDHPQVALTLGNLGNIHRDRGDLDAAEDAQRRALSIKEAAYGPDHPEVAITLTNLGNIHQHRGDLDAAEDAQRRALAIMEAAYGPDHPQVAITLTNLGNIHQDRGALDAAGDAQRRALAIKEAAYGPDHPQVAITLTNLGNIHRDRGDLDAAEDAQRRALAIKEAAYGPDHPSVAITLGNLGNIHRDRGDLDAAEAATSRALAIFEARLPADHPHTRIARDNLASIREART